MHEIRWGKYIFVLVLTLGILAIAFLASNFFYQAKLKEIQSVEDRITLNLLASEVQFDLLKQLPCTAGALPVVSEDLNTLAERISFLEGERGDKDPEVRELKRRYSLFQIKDYLAVRDISKRCNLQLHTVLYFYSNVGDCPDCKRQGFVLSNLRATYPDLRVYAFDYNLDAAGIEALRKIYKIEGSLPAVFANDLVYHGFLSLEDFATIFPDLVATSTATSTEVNSKSQIPNNR